MHLKAGIARALATKQAKPLAARALIDEFRKQSDQKVKWEIGNALEVVAGDAVSQELIDLASEKEHGRSRQMIVYALGRVKDPRAVDVLIQQLADDEVVVQAAAALGRLRALSAKPYLEALLTHPLAHREVRRALRKIDKEEAEQAR